MDNVNLIVTSKVKAYIKDKADLKFSGECIDVLSDKIRALCDEAIANAGKERRKTVKSRDFA